MGTESVKIQSRLKGAAAPLALSIMLVAQPVLAQDDTDTSDDSAEATSDEPSATPIIVTGSRIRRDEFSSAAPLTVVDPAIAVKSGMIDTASMVQGSPIAAGSSQVTAAISNNYVTNGGTGTETISLRGLGAERTLVLLNGRRAGPAGTRGAVSAFDLNVLPQSIVKSVDILKDGASSIYGSDAVAGVVNLITKTDTNGIELDLFGSAPFQSGGETFNASATWGKTFDRGHILVSANYYRRNELARGDRKYLQCEENYVFTDETFTERADLVDPRSGKFACGGDESNITWGHVWAYDYFNDFANPLDDEGNPINGPQFGQPNIPGSDGRTGVYLFQYDYDGTLAKFLKPVPSPLYAGQAGIPEGWFIVGETPEDARFRNNYHPLMDNDTVIPQTDRYTLYVDGSYELTDSIEAYGEFIFSKRKNYVNGSAQPYVFGWGETLDYIYDVDGDGVIDPSEQFYIPYNANAEGWTGAVFYSPTGYTDQNDSKVEVDYYRAVLGLRGDITSNWSWDVYGQWSRSDGSYSNQQRLKDALARGGRPCPANYVTPISKKACVDVEWYTGRVMYGDYTDAERDFIIDWETGNTRYDQWYVEAIVTGDLFELPAGAVGIAAGVNYREDYIKDTPGAITLANNAFQALSSGITSGSTQTKEAFAEINVPILADVPLIQSLDFSGAARITNVEAIRESDGATDSRNGNWTYKLGLDWAVNDWLRFRGTYGTSYRAPALFEQFLADQKGGLSQRDIDPCINWGNNLADGVISQSFADNCAADGVAPDHNGSGSSANIYTGGGFGLLDPETSTAWTASMVLTPKFDFLPNTQFSLAVDYFDIEVKGEIAQFGAGNILAQCYASEFFPNDPLCDLFARVGDLDPSDPDYIEGDQSNIAFVRDSFINVASQQNRGVDVTFRAVHDFAGDTTLTFQSQMTWQTKDSVALFEGFPVNDNGEAGEPKWVGDFNLTLDTGPWSFFYGVDVIGGTDDTGDWLRDNGTLCPTYVTLGTVCLDLTTDATFYHNLSVTREFGDHIRVTAGVSNIFNTTPPRVSSIGGNGIQNYGQGVLYSQYDLIGTRGFLNVNVKY